MSETPNLDGLITRHIGDILAAWKRLTKLNLRLWEEAAIAARTTEFADWITFADTEEEEVWLANRDWMVPDSQDKQADFCLGLDERTAPGQDGEESWLATFTGSGPESATLGLWVIQDILGSRGWKKLLKSNDPLVQKLCDAGFQYDDEDDRRLCVPILIDREKLAVAFEEDDFVEAMLPITQAIETAVAASHELKKLRQLAIAAV